MKKIKSILLPVLALGVLTACTDEELAEVTEPGVEVVAEELSEKEKEKLAEEKKKEEEHEKIKEEQQKEADERKAKEAEEKKKEEEAKKAEEEAEAKIEAERLAKEQEDDEIYEAAVDFSENLFLENMKSEFSGMADVEFDEELNSFRIIPTSAQLMSEIETMAITGVVPSGWTYMVDSFVDLSLAIEENIEPGYSISMANPFEKSNTILIISDGQILYDVTDDM